MQAHEPNKAKPEVKAYYFIENKGQWPINILFRAEIPQGNVLITAEGITYQIVSYEATKSKGVTIEDTNGSMHSSHKIINGHIVNVRFTNSNTNFKLSKKKLAKANFQFIKGKDPNKWIQDTKAWEQIELLNLYDGINLKLYFANGLLKYDFVVSPKSDPNQISLLYEGADSLKIEDGSLAMYTSLGKVYEKPPYSYQMTDKGKKEISCRFLLEKKNVRFELSKKYDPTLPLIIDPELIFSTYSGSRADNWGNTATFDSSGNLYSGGIVLADSAFPVTPGPFQTFSAGNADVLILKYSPDGKNLLFAAYLGGSNTEIPISMIVNGKNELVILGITGSYDFPVSSDAFDNTFNGGVITDAFFNLDGTILHGNYPELELSNGTDIFIAVINTFTNTFIASTFVGGSDNDGFIQSLTPPAKNYGDQLRGEVIVDAQDNIYIASHTYSANIEGISSTLASNKGYLDAMMLKFSPTLNSLDWIYWHGGTGHESGFGLKQDKNGNFFLTGSTTSSDVFTSPINGIHPNYMGGIDGYIAKVSGTSGTLMAGTYIGTPLFDQSYFIDIDSNNDVYVFGLTKGDYPVTPNVYFNTDGGQFIHKLNNDLSSTVFSTKIGSGKKSTAGEIIPDISPTAFMVNDCRKIFLSGWGGAFNRASQTINYTISNGNQLYKFIYNTGYMGGNISGMPTKDAFQSTTNGTGFYFMILQPEASSLAYATYFGGTYKNYEHVDGGTSRFDKKGIIYQSVCAGCGGYSNFPTPIPGVWSVTNNSYDCNNASLKFDLGKVVAKLESFDSLSALPSKYGCVPITFLLKNQSSGATNYKWDLGNGIYSYKPDSIYVKFKQTGTRDITLIAYDTTICLLVDTAKTTIKGVDIKVDFPGDILQCGTTPQNPVIKLYGNAKVVWTPSEGLSDPTIPNPIVSYTGKDMVYYISVTNDTLCQKRDTLHVKIRDSDPKTKLIIRDINKLNEKYEFCYPSEAYFSTKSTPHDYIEWKEDGNFLLSKVDSFPYFFPRPGKIKYQVMIYDSICQKSATDTKYVTLSIPQPTYPNDTSICPNTSIYSKVIGEKGFTYLWEPSSLFSSPTSDKQLFYPKTSGTVQITVTDTIGCSANDSFNYNIFSVDDAVKNKEQKYCSQKAEWIEIYASNMSNYLWQPGNFSGNPLKVNKAGTYYLTGNDVNNCPVRDTIKVFELCDPELHVPSAFSPNDDGQNDFFQVFGHNIVRFDIKIFDRWGELIYHSTDFRFKWDGEYKGQVIPIGTYPFVVSYGGTTYDGDNLTKTFSGDVTVVR